MWLLSNYIVPVAGFEPTNPCQDAGLQIRCGCQFRHTGLAGRGLLIASNDQQGPPVRTE